MLEVEPGMAGAATLRTTTSWKFIANRAERKLVFMSVGLAVADVTIFEGDVAVSQTQHIDISNLRCHTAPGLMLLAPDAELPRGELLSRYPLAEDASGAVAEYEYKYEQGAIRALEIGVSALGSKVKVRADVSIGETLTLRHQLRGGFDYALHGLAGGDGLLWSEPRTAP